MRLNQKNMEVIKLKKVGIPILAISMILLLLIITITITPTPIAVAGNGNQTSPPGDRHDGGRFVVILCPSSTECGWVEGWVSGKTLACSVSLIGTCCVQSSSWQAITYKIEIPEGTVVSGYYPGQGRVIYLEIKVVDGQLHFSPNLRLSQPATLYKLVDGEWVEVLSFTEILNGKAS